MELTWSVVARGKNLNRVRGEFKLPQIIQKCGLVTLWVGGAVAAECREMHTQDLRAQHPHPRSGLPGQSTKKAQTKEPQSPGWTQKAAGLGTPMFLSRAPPNPRPLLDEFPGNAPASPGLPRLSEVPDLIGLKN